MALGAYNIAPGIVDVMGNMIEDLASRYYPILSSGQNVRVRIQQATEKYLEANLDPFVEMLRVDFNRKIPYRGLMPRIKTEIVTNTPHMGAYSFHHHTIQVKSDVYNATEASGFYSQSSMFVNPKEIYSRFIAQEIVGTIVHEFTHASQAYPYINRDDQHDYEKSFRAVRGSGPSYQSSLNEIGSFAVNHILVSSVFCKKEFYSNPLDALMFSWWFLGRVQYLRSHSILHFANIRERLYVKNYTEQELEDELFDWYKKAYQGEWLSELSKEHSRDMHRKLDRKKYFIVDFFKKTRPGRYGQGFQQFIEDFEPYYQTYLRAISRNFHLFKPINDRFALLNANSYR